MGCIIHYFEVQPFIVTLAGMFLARGLCYAITATPSRSPSPVYVAIAEHRIPCAGGMYVSTGVLIAAAAVVVGVYVLHYTRFGRNVYAIGGNEQSALLMGLPGRPDEDRGLHDQRLLLGARRGPALVLHARPATGSLAVGMELDAIAAVVIGGTLLTGGSGYVLGTVLGVLVLGLIQTLITFQGTLSSWWTKIVIGAAAVRVHPAAAAGPDAQVGPMTESGDQGTKSRRAVMADVAKLAGVSHQTVSRVINSSELVREDTREKVREAMRLLDYRPNPVARALATGKSRTLGVLTFDNTLYGPASTLVGVERAARQAGYSISIVSLFSLDRSAVLDAVERLRTQGVDGILVIAPQTADVRAVAQLPHDFPVVAVEAGPDQGVPVAAVDQVAGAALATQHLLDLGHPTVWHIAGPNDWLEARQRLSGWRSTLQAAGAPVPPVLIGDWSAESGYTLGRQLAADPEVTAVFAGNDLMALGLLRVLHEEGRELPASLSVVGFDDMPEVAYFTPPLTTVRQDFTEVGRQSVHLLLDEIQSGARSSARATVAPELIVRESTAAPRG